MQRTEPHKVDFNNDLDETIIREALKGSTVKQISIAANCTHHQVKYCLKKANLNLMDYRNGTKSSEWFRTTRRMLGRKFDSQLDAAARIVLRKTGKL